MAAGVLALCTAEARAQSLPPGWSTADIGRVGAVGSASGAGGSFTIAGAGADIWGSADAFRFVYTPLVGDSSIVSQVASVEWVNDWTKAGVMMRETLAPGSTHAMMIVSANKGLAFQRRPVTGGTSVHTSGGAGKAPYFVKLARTGDTFTASVSPDGTTWARVGAETIRMASTIYVGLAVSSHVYGQLATASFASTVMTGTPPTPANETIVFLRHAEKPPGGYGQITCQGLRRALALPDVLTTQFGAPQFIFAPNPLPQIPDGAGSFDYVRPLATIEPTAIRFGLPVNAQFGFSDITGLQDALLSPSLASSTVFVAWEHLKLQEVVQNIMNAYGSGVTVPPWPSDDFDSLYIVRLTSKSGPTTAQFEQRVQGLNGLPVSCPQ